MKTRCGAGVEIVLSTKSKFMCVSESVGVAKQTNQNASPHLHIFQSTAHIKRSLSFSPVPLQHAHTLKDISMISSPLRPLSALLPQLISYSPTNTHPSAAAHLLQSVDFERDLSPVAGS